LFSNKRKLYTLKWVFIFTIGLLISYNPYCQHGWIQPIFPVNYAPETAEMMKKISSSERLVTHPVSDLINTDIDIPPRNNTYEKYKNIRKKIAQYSEAVIESYGQKNLLPIADYDGISDFAGHISYVNTVDFSPNKSLLASGSKNGKIFVWNVTTGNIHRAFDHGSQVNALVFHKNGTILASGGGDSNVKIWNLVTGTSIQLPDSHVGAVNSVAFSPNGTLLASCSTDQTINLWNVDDGFSVLDPLTGHFNSVNALSFSPNSSLLASGSSDTDIFIWDMKSNSGSPRKILDNHTSSVDSIVFSSDEQFLVSGSGFPENNLTIWNGTTGDLLHSIDAHQAGVRSVDIDPMCQIIASSSADGSVKLWNLTSKIEIRNMTRHSGEVKSVSFNNDGMLLASGSTDQSVKIWNLNIGVEIDILKSHTDSVLTVQYSPNGSLIASGSEDKDIKLWNATTGDYINEINNAHGNRIKTLDFSPNSTLIASGSIDNFIKIWNVNTRTLIHTFELDVDIESVAFHPNGSTLVTGSTDDIIRFWDVDSGDSLVNLTNNGGDILSLDFSSNGDYLIAGLGNNMTKIWKLAPLEPILTLNNHTNEVVSVAFSPDGKYFATGSKDKSVLIYNAITYELIHNLTGHSNQIRAITFSPDGTALSTSADDQTIRIWNSSNGIQLRELYNQYNVLSIAFSPNGERLISGYLSYNDIHVWNVSTFLFKFENASSSLLTWDSELKIQRNPNSLLSANWNDDHSQLISDFSIPSIPSDVGENILHIKTTHLGKNISRDYSFFIIASRDDYDGDGMPNTWEEANGTEIFIDDAWGDLDNDELFNLEEFQEGTDPNNNDTDYDGWYDSSEVANSSNPLKYNEPPSVNWGYLNDLNNSKIGNSSLSWQIKETEAMSIKIWLNGEPEPVQTDPFSWSVDLIEEDNNITIRAFYDLETNYNQTVFIITLDTTAPVISLIYPTQNNILKSNSTILINVDDENADLYYCWDSGTYNETILRSFIIPSTEGSHILYLEAIDEIGNRNNESFSFITDDTKPKIHGLNIAPAMRGVNTITVNASDENGIDRVEFMWAGTVVENDSNSPYIWEWDTEEVKDGKYDINILVYDLAGNLLEEEEQVEIINDDINELLYRIRVFLQDISQNINILALIVFLVILLVIFILFLCYILNDFAFDVFISYSTENKDFIDYLVKTFEKNKIPYFIDSSEIELYQKLESVITRGIQKSQFVVGVVSKHYLSSYWCILEALTSIKLTDEKKILLPIYLEDYKEKDSITKKYIRDLKLELFEQSEEIKKEILKTEAFDLNSQIKEIDLVKDNVQGIFDYSKANLYVKFHLDDRAKWKDSSQKLVTKIKSNTKKKCHFVRRINFFIRKKFKRKGNL
jgi:WD40 repeat protein